MNKSITDQLNSILKEDDKDSKKATNIDKSNASKTSYLPAEVHSEIFQFFNPESGRKEKEMSELDQELQLFREKQANKEALNKQVDQFMASIPSDAHPVITSMIHKPPKPKVEQPTEEEDEIEVREITKQYLVAK
jgi:hypothetical protein